MYVVMGALTQGKSSVQDLWEHPFLIAKAPKPEKSLGCCSEEGRGGSGRDERWATSKPQLCHGVPGHGAQLLPGGRRKPKELCAWKISAELALCRPARCPSHPNTAGCPPSLRWMEVQKPYLVCSLF